jgi:hypothetical protein
MTACPSAISEAPGRPIRLQENELVMSTFSYRWFPAVVLSLVAIVVAASGCGSHKKVTINGTVSYKGQRLSGGMVQLVGLQGGPPSAALIRTDGTFIMPDVVPGEVKVSIVATPLSSGHSGGKPAFGPTIAPADLPEEYRDPATSGLRYTITPDTRRLDINMD